MATYHGYDSAESFYKQYDTVDHRDFPVSENLPRLNISTVKEISRHGDGCWFDEGAT